MEAPSPRYILTRAAFLLACLVAALYATSFIKKKQRESAIAMELKSLAGESSYFQQFYPEDAAKTLVRAVGLIAEAASLGMDPDKVIDRALGREAKFFASDTDDDEPAPRVRIIGSSLRSNYQNFLKLGFKPDFPTLREMKEGTLPAIPSGPEEGRHPLVEPLIPESASPGITKVVANLQIRPPHAGGRPLSDVEVASAKQLARDLAEANVIETPVRDRIVAALTPPKPEAPGK